MDQRELFEALMPFKRKLLMAARIFRILYERSIEELRHEPPEYVFVVDLNWLKRCKDFLYYNQMTDYTTDEAAFLEMVSVAHLDVGHPRPCENINLLKNFDKYIRVDTTEVLEPEDLVCSKKM